MNTRISCFTILLLSCLFSLAAEVSVTGKLHNEQTANPGESYTGTILLTNDGNKQQDVKIYQTDYQFFADGTSLYDDPGTDARSNAKWITLSTTRLSIAAGGTSLVNFRVDVPSENTLSGSYWSLLMIESIPEESPESSSGTSQTSIGILQVIRYAFQMVTNISDTGNIKLKFADTKLQKEAGKIILAIDVESIGERTARVLLSCELYDNKGNLYKKIDGGSHRLHPGSSRKYELDLTDLPKNKYKALIVLDCGDENVFGKNINLSL